MTTHATPTYCGLCGSATWTQTIPYTIRLDPTPLTSVSEELTHRLWGHTTYQLFKTTTTFEATIRHPWNLDGDYTNKIVLTDHTCHRLKLNTHPNYWPTEKASVNRDLPPY